MTILTNKKLRQQGFTLIEIVVGMVVTALALTFLSTLFFSNPGRSIEPLLQIRAAEFGQALVDEILGKQFDETSPIGGVPSCLPCTASGALGPDGETRGNYNDVDDYNSYCGDEPGNVGWPVIGSLGDRDFDGDIDADDVPEGFDNYRMRVCVGYDGDYDGIINEGGSDDLNAKLIRVDVFAPQVGGLSSAISFSVYKGNF